jgi:hypothetical protein
MQDDPRPDRASLNSDRIGAAIVFDEATADSVLGASSS